MAAKRARPARRAVVKAKSRAKPSRAIRPKAKVAAKAKRPAKASARVAAKAVVRARVAAKAKVQGKARAKVPATVTAPKQRGQAPRVAISSEATAVLQAAEVQGLISRLPPPVQPMMLRLRSLFLESAPEATELIENAAPAYFAQGVFARIEAQDRAVLVRFLRGHELPSSSELAAEGDTRTLLVSSVEDVKADVLRKLVREAVMINLNHARPA